MRCWCGYPSGARCRLFAYGPADATACHRVRSRVYETVERPSVCPPVCSGGLSLCLSRHSTAAAVCGGFAAYPSSSGATARAAARRSAANASSVTFTADVGSGAPTHHSSPSSTHSFHPRLKTSFSEIPSHCSPSFLILKYLLRGFHGLFTVISEHICFLLLVFFLFLHFLVVGFRAVD